MEDKLFEKLPGFRENLNPVATAIADIDEPVFRDVHTDNNARTNRISQRAELLRRRTGRVVIRTRAIVDFAQRNAVGSPTTFEGSGVRVVHHDPPVEIS